MRKLSLVICVYNEEQNIAPLCKRIIESLEGFDYDAIFVDDGSSDQTVREIKKINDSHFILIELKKNYGQSTALQAGIDYAQGEYIATLDGDLQNDPIDIPMMLNLAEREDWDLVAGIRAHRQDGMFLRKVPSKIANYIIRNTTGVRMKDYGCTLKVFKKDTAKSIHIYGELHRFIPILASLEGATITQVEVHHHPRQFGKSKYGIGRTSRVISDLLLMLFFKKYFQRPMHIFGGIGILTFAIGVIINLYMLLLKILGHDIWGKPMLILGIALLFIGVQFITIGLIAEVIMRTYFESQHKAPYRIRRVSNVGE